MNYEKIYKQLIEKRKKTPAKEGFINTHHILPRHSGGTDEIDNLVILTYKEHIFAHKLLYKIYNNYYDLYAALLMSSKTEEAAKLLKVEGGRKGGRRTQELYGFKVQSAGGKVGGKIAGQINKESGHIYKLAKENQSLATECKKWSAKYVLIDPEGNIYYHVGQMLEKYPDVSSAALYTRCRKGTMGFSKRLKTEEEIEYSKKQIELLKSNKRNELI